jgi:putative acyl-CoA dehydrogenase
MQRFPDCVPALIDELRLSIGADHRYEAALDGLESDLARIALLMSASLLIRHSPEIADAFIATRLAGQWSGQFGDLPQVVDAGAIARRAVPVLA